MHLSSMWKLSRAGKRCQGCWLLIKDVKASNSLYQLSKLSTACISFQSCQQLVSVIGGVVNAFLNGLRHLYKTPSVWQKSALECPFDYLGNAQIDGALIGKGLPLGRRYCGANRAFKLNWKALLCLRSICVPRQKHFSQSTLQLCSR